ncbi:MAG: hypothetical protein V3U24_04570 [Candidatus Neomarinimicrobiota bacterium]
MNEIIIGFIILIVLLVVFLFGKRHQLAHVESRREAKRAERESWTGESVMSYGQIQEIREELIQSMEEKLSDEPEHVERLRKIINDWADLKIESFTERRSWVRKPDETKKE